MNLSVRSSRRKDKSTHPSPHHLFIHFWCSVIFSVHLIPLNFLWCFSHARVWRRAGYILLSLLLHATNLHGHLVTSCAFDNQRPKGTQKQSTPPISAVQQTQHCRESQALIIHCSGHFALHHTCLDRLNGFCKTTPVLAREEAAEFPYRWMPRQVRLWLDVPSGTGVIKVVFHAI